MTILLPALRERRQDIPELVQHFLSTRQIGSTPFRITAEALETLTHYDWPGNIRELANVLERAQILAEEHTISLDDLPENLVDHHALMQRHAIAVDGRQLRAVERQHVLEVLQHEKGNKVHAAKVLGISRRALYRLIKKHRLSDDECHGVQR